MIRVTIEMLPGGNEENRYTMHVIEVANNLYTSLLDRKQGSYNYKISRKLTSDKVSWHKTGTVSNFPRSAKNSVHLLLAVLKDAYDEH